MAPNSAASTFFSSSMVRGGNASPSWHQKSQPISPGRYAASSWALSRTILAASSTSTPMPSPGNHAILYFAIKYTCAPDETALRPIRQEREGAGPDHRAHLAGTANQRKRMAEGDARHNPQ